VAGFVKENIRSSKGKVDYLKWFKVLPTSQNIITIIKDSRLWAIVLEKRMDEN
jgi:hypothetical protein